MICKTISKVRFLIITLSISLKKGECFDFTSSLGSFPCYPQLLNCWVKFIFSACLFAIPISPLHNELAWNRCEQRLNEIKHVKSLKKQMLLGNLDHFYSIFSPKPCSLVSCINFLGLFAYLKERINLSCLREIWVSTLLTLESDNRSLCRISKYYWSVHALI